MSRKKLNSPVRKLANRGFRGYPLGTIALYGPDDQVASKLVVGIVPGENEELTALKRWFAEDHDIRQDPAVEPEILAFLKSHRVKTVVITDGLIGCPHEEGIDYPDGEACPQCPYWENRDRFTKEPLS